ncbi:hypothetical protein HG537_0G00920 [Torulaspora globosa]|uniref:EamA domain-containing protein n=1 Tax=Torulaspora globosa TaxID=48254 RepID=A0A7H9HVT1_9SACH|nr:hypothetical protein HG537_0G00920 [Torulaspora sp. CBS 2947]
MSKKDSSKEFDVDVRLHSEESGYSAPNTGLVLLIISYFFNSSMVVSTKVLETDHEGVPGQEPIKPLQILLVRMSITYVATLLYMFKNRSSIPNVPFGPPEMRKWLVLRGVMGFFGVFGLYFSLMYLSLSDAILITFLTPTVTVLLAWIVLRERLTTIEAIGSLISFCGVVLIVRPSFIFGVPTAPDGSAESENTADRLIATVLSLVGVLGASSVYIIIRHMGTKAHAILSVSYFSLVVTVISLLGLLLFPSMTFQTPTNLKQWLLFANLGVCGFVFQYLLTLGIQKERAGRGTLMAYTQLIYAVFWDVALWHNWPKLWSWLGMLIIVGTALVVIRYKPKAQLARISDEERESFELEEM